MPAQQFSCPGFWPAALYREQGIYEAPYGTKSSVKRPVALSGAEPPEAQPVSLVSCPSCLARTSVCLSGPGPLPITCYPKVLDLWCSICTDWENTVFD